MEVLTFDISVQAIGSSIRSMFPVRAATYLSTEWRVQGVLMALRSWSMESKLILKVSLTLEVGSPG